MSRASAASRLFGTGKWKMDAKTRIAIFSLMKSGWEEESCDGSIPLQQQSAESVLCLSLCGDTNSYAQRIPDAEWIFSREETLLLAATGTTSEMPGGILRLIHEREFI